MQASTEAAIARYFAQQRERGKEWERRVAALVKDFKLPDRGTLLDALAVAALEYGHARLTGDGGPWSEREANALDWLDKALWPTVGLLRYAQYPIAQKLVESSTEEFGSEMSEVEDQLLTLTNRLAIAGRAAASIPRRRRKNVRPRVDDVRRLVAPLAAYWADTLHRPFTADWGKPRGPTAFVTEAISAITAREGYPTPGPKSVGTAVKEIVAKMPGPRRGRGRGAY